MDESYSEVVSPLLLSAYTKRSAVSDMVKIVCVLSGLFICKHRRALFMIGGGYNIFTHHRIRLRQAGTLFSIWGLRE